VAVVARSSSNPSPVLDNFHARMRSGFGTYFTREDIQRLKPTYMSDLVTRVPGLWVATSGRGTERQIYSNRNAGGLGRDCPAQIFVDGRLMNPRLGGVGEVVGMSLDEAVHPNDVEGIEIYRGLATVPAEFLTPDARCAVIAVWTRRGGGRPQ
jgi:vitamin B12 transporter